MAPIIRNSVEVGPAPRAPQPAAAARPPAPPAPLWCLTVETLSGNQFNFRGVSPDLKLACLADRVAEELQLKQGEVVQLVEGMRVFGPNDATRTLAELGVGDGAVLSAVVRLSLQPGDTVMVDGLEAMRELNCVQGVCEEWVQDRGRWLVTLHVRRVTVPVECILEPPLEELAPGMEVRLSDRQTLFKDLDRSRILVDAVIGDSHVTLLQLTKRLIRPEHLHFVSSRDSPAMAAMMLTNEGEERDAQPAAGVDAALGEAFLSRGVLYYSQAYQQAVSRRRSCLEGLGQ